MLSPTAATAAASASAEPVPKHTYHAFMAKMQQPSASGLFRSIKLFVRDLLSDTQRSVDEVAEAVQAFELQSFAADAEDLNGTPPGFRHADGTRAGDNGTPV